MQSDAPKFKPRRSHTQLREKHPPGGTGEKGPTPPFATEKKGNQRKSGRSIIRGGG